LEYVLNVEHIKFFKQHLDDTDLNFIVEKINFPNSIITAVT